MSDSLRRGIRTFLDVLLAVLTAGAVDAFLVDLDSSQRAVLVVALTSVISVLKNALEDRGTIPALLKAPASDGANPEPDDDAPDEDYQSLMRRRPLSTKRRGHPQL